LALVVLGYVQGFNRGVVFEQERDVLLTDSYWTLALDYNLTEVEVENHNLSKILLQVKGQYDAFFEELMHKNLSVHSQVFTLEASFRYQYASLQQLVTEYVGKTGDLTTLLPRTLKKRGLVDAGGHILKFLFGTADSRDLEIIDERMESLSDAVDEISHNSEDKLTVLNNMQTELIDHSRSINKIISTLRDYHKVMHENMAKYYVREVIIANQVRDLFRFLKLDTALSEIKDVIDLAVQRMDRFHQALEHLAAGKFSSHLLDPHHFLLVLRSIERAIPAPSKLFLEVKLENLHDFYKFATVRSYATSSQLKILVNFPIKIDSQLYESYNIVPYPVFDHVLNRWVKWEVTNHKLLLSKDRQTYSVYESDEFVRECKIGTLVVCPLSTVLMSVHKRPSCAVELFLEKKTTLCQRTWVLGLKSPVIVRTPTRWLYSTAEATRVTLNCLGTGAGLNVSQVTLDGVGEIPGRDGCDLIADGYRVPARFHGSTQYTGEFGKLVFPEVLGVYNTDEIELMGSDWNETLQVFQSLDNELGTLSVREYPLEASLHHLRSHRHRREVLKFVTLGSLLVTLAVILVLCLIFRGWVRRLARATQCCLPRGQTPAAQSEEEARGPPLRSEVVIPMTAMASVTTLRQPGRSRVYTNPGLASHERVYGAPAVIKRP
jgi:hypothetical protein